MESKFEWQMYLYYFLIGVISLIACVFIPMMGTELGVNINVPDTVAGWVVFLTTKLIIAIINILIFYCFMEQAKLNVKDNPNYIEANKILIKSKKKIRMPRSPQKWTKRQYGAKGTVIFITSILSAFALTNAVLMFDLVQMLTYVFVIIMGLVFGLIQMKSAETYWTIEYYEYAKIIEEEILCLNTMESNIET